MRRCGMDNGSERATAMPMASWFTMCGTALSVTTASTTGRMIRSACRNTAPDVARKWMEGMAMADEYILRSIAIAKLTALEVTDPFATIADAKRVLADMAAADVAPVVRCKDCKYGDYDSKPDGAMVCLRTKDGFWRKETDFCSYGERKDNDEH